MLTFLRYLNKIRETNLPIYEFSLIVKDDYSEGANKCDTIDS